MIGNIDIGKIQRI